MSRKAPTRPATSAARSIRRTSHPRRRRCVPFRLLSTIRRVCSETSAVSPPAAADSRSIASTRVAFMSVDRWRARAWRCAGRQAPQPSLSLVGGPRHLMKLNLLRTGRTGTLLFRLGPSRSDRRRAAPRQAAADVPERPRRFRPARTSWVTTAPAPICAPSPIRRPPMITAPEPMLAPLPTTRAAAASSRRPSGGLQRRSSRVAACR